jgi:hypothetical protein
MKKEYRIWALPTVHFEALDFEDKENLIEIMTPVRVTSSDPDEVYELWCKDIPIRCREDFEVSIEEA